MAKLKGCREKFIIIYVRFFRHYRTKKLVFPKPPNTHLRLRIRADKWRAYQDRKAARHGADATR